MRMSRKGEPDWLDMTLFPPMVNDRGTQYPVSDMVLSFLVEEEGPST
jgi:hypothetical protein